MNAPNNASIPPAAHAPRISAGEWTRCATSDGFAKIPAPTIPPITIIVASKSPSCLTGAAKPLAYHSPLELHRDFTGWHDDLHSLEDFLGRQSLQTWTPAGDG